MWGHHVYPVSAVCDVIVQVYTHFVSNPIVTGRFVYIMNLHYRLQV